MKLKNISASIISIGKTVALPGQVVDITADEYKNNSVINFFVKTKRLVEVKGRTAKEEIAEESKVETVEEEVEEEVKETKKTKSSTKKASSE